jgi:hypothetical protein
MLLRIINILTLIASSLLLASLSAEIIYSAELAQFSNVYSWAMFGVCVIFIIDFFALMFSKVKCCIPFFDVLCYN